MAISPALLPHETQRLVLRAPAFDDVPRLSRLGNDHSIARNLRSMPFPFGEMQASALIGDMLASNMNGEGLACVIALRDKPHVVVGLISFLRHGETAEIGYWIGRTQRRKGYAREACLAILALALSDLLTQRIEAGVFADNEASLALLTSLGFVMEREDMAPSLGRTTPSEHRWFALSRTRTEQRLAKGTKHG
jgi:RimJ/RimL family protein N-acetyltransferase